MVASGLYCAVNLTLQTEREPRLELRARPPPEPCPVYKRRAAGDFQPMNINFGIISPLPNEGKKMKKRDKSWRSAAGHWT